MKKIILLFSFLYLVKVGYAQSYIGKAPGGVKGVIKWFIVDTVLSYSILKNKIDSSYNFTPTNKEKAIWINHHPVMNFDGKSQLSLNLGFEDFNQATFFTVYHSIDTSKENMIWHLERNGDPLLLLTTKRMADFDDYKYMNFTDLSPLTPKINVYEQNKPIDSIPIFTQKWNIGFLPAFPKLPVSNLNGSIAEILAFNRNLNREERLKVSSYLALKYGITLSEPSGTYLNSSGETIWNGLDHTDYHHNIAGIGRDDISGFNQKTATSSNDPNLFSISLESDPLNHDFLIWGDNNKSLKSANKQDGIPAALNRKWLLNTHGNTAIFKTVISLDTKMIFTSTHPKPVYWMAIDTTGVGDFTSSAIQYIKSDQVDKKGFAHFRVSWKNNRSIKNIFTFIAGQDLLVATNIKEPSCHTLIKGQIHIKMFGGQPPYMLSISNGKESPLVLIVQGSEHSKIVTNLEPGSYSLKMEDANHLIYRDSFIINHAEAPHSVNLSDEYELKPGQSLQLNASEKIESDISYQWTGPNSFLSNNPKINIIENGIYIMTLNKNGCIFSKRIKVNSLAENIFTAELLYPNPSDGLFNLKLSLGKSATVSFTVFTEDGAIILNKRVSGSDHYFFSDKLTSDGIYYLSLQSGNSILTKKLIIMK